MHSRCTLNIRPNVLVLQFACSLAHAPTPSISVTLFFTIVNASELVYLARTLYISLLAFLHLSRFASTNWSSPRISSVFPIPLVSAAFSISASSPFKPLLLNPFFCNC